MKKSEVKHLFNENNEIEKNEPELVFTHYIATSDGTKIAASLQPDSYDHVRRIHENIFLAWDNLGGESRPVIYLGKYVTK